MPELLASAADKGAAGLADRFRATRRLSEALVAPLSDADATIQSMEDASPAKWHLAHTTWFWETFLLRDHARGYQLFDDQYPFLFNSYYEAEGERIARFSRGMLSRPTLEQILEWRAHVDAAMEPLLDDPAHTDLIELGVAHEQQHQELLLTDIKHALFQNPLGPAMFDGASQQAIAPQERWHEHPGGIAMIGHEGSGFAFDNEGPRHRVLLEPFALSKHLVTNREWAEFIADGGYANAALWLSDGWAWVRENGISAPLYWRDEQYFTLQGWQDCDPEAPVTHISYFEADAFASWVGNRLPTEFEWEAMAQTHGSATGNQLDEARGVQPTGSDCLFGDCWQFTRSAYLPYPRFRPAAGAVGEYNGKFMSGQFVLKGASCATVRGHSRASYRNFFYPHQRWQFTGLRLAKDI
ncbi:ergothioneine biosynthesis protein EgtB [Altererythrobacter sp.]|uniref:ergothioneine biosynthesis protein EgtB n=1 Tax=Altererythrobacter sp. TaxID=1872480 RepID=UPI001B2D44A1|nr:ergothioneine biosynthesis protein EgtB [Altererythrobacter sp.]MBO6608700.1 ergothioneine biosynthesis protein EgtB [Altererythrobacter sp.]MBO6642955.1 ergothioneine biosynthesis protein EgtB [Altererythrobacter sp.]MBO6709698.1 ergothioneine biosynthesis protein EgtB [Altererythrobacter sp.]